MLQFIRLIKMRDIIKRNTCLRDTLFTPRDFKERGPGSGNLNESMTASIIDAVDLEKEYGEDN